MADELENIGYAILSNSRYTKARDFTSDLEKLKIKIDGIVKTDHTASNLVLKKVFINLRDLNQQVLNIFNYYNSKSSEVLIEKAKKVEYSRFVTHQDYAPHIFWDNLTLKSATFKHAFRVALVCLVGFITARTIALGHHSYWVLLTIIVILKPGFSLSKQRNYQRLIGTIGGGVIGILILVFIPNKDIQFVFLVIFMVLAYSFQRLNYIASVIFMTPYVLILFKFLGVGHLNIAEERVIDTLIGSSIAFAASYLIFPTWEFEQVQDSLADVIHANAEYLVKLAEAITTGELNITEYKLARKDVFVKSANLSAIFERMTSEPKSKQKGVKEIHKFVVLNHILSSYIATIASGFSDRVKHLSSQENLKLIRRSIAVLNDTIQKLGGQNVDFSIEKSFMPTESTSLSPDEKLLTEQLGFVHKISTDIAKITDNILTAV
jgi:uncharacterized membrane protein YccC